MAREYHVAKCGNDKNDGTKQAPFFTISRAAKVADEGDTVIVHEGEYREYVSPERGARTELGRITYMAAEGEKAVIKGSEIVTGWEKKGSLWTVCVDHAIFGNYNPYAEEVEGDWMARPLDYKKHTGMVYFEGEPMLEASHQDDCAEREMTWFACVSEEKTCITANFGEKDPNAFLTEINVRRSCFMPEKTGLNFITVRGFEIAHAATPWAPPTADQIGMIGPHWAKGWIIEDNIIHDARCSAVSLGKEISTGHNLYTQYHRKPGYNYQYEAMLAGFRLGWKKENIGSHIVRNNVIYNCGQNGVVGHMGGSYSEIYGNEIYHIGDRNEFWGHELGAIKLHALIDTQIHHNIIHDCYMGVWLDWQAQGARMSSNIFYRNTIDMKWEVTHGPHLVDNNIFGSEQNFQNAAQGGAYVHNLFLGGMYHYEVYDRSTPYHLPHSTEMMGCSLVYKGDDRFYNNIFANTQTAENRRFVVGLGHYNGSPDTLEEYVQTVWEKHGKCDAAQFATVQQPLYTAHNYYADGVPSYERDHTSVKTEAPSHAKIVEENGNLYLEMDIDASFASLCAEIVDTKRLGMTRITEALYENPDGSAITIDFDLLGAPRGMHPTVGPIENIGTGRVKILLKKGIRK